MAKLYINGKKRLFGEVKVHGAKNSTLPILAATLLNFGESEIHNCPDLLDVETSLKILSHLGCVCTRDGDIVTVKSDTPICSDIPESLMGEMRSSVIFSGALLGRVGEAKISSPGGCELGPRPIDIHISAFKKMGISVTESDGHIYCRADNGILPSDITLPFPSVGATENIMLAATSANGKTIIRNAAKEPEICDLANFLNSAGAAVFGAGTDTVEIFGRKRLNATKHRVIPDRIEAFTFLTATAATRSKITVKNAEPAHLKVPIDVLRQCGCEIRKIEDKIEIDASHGLYGIKKVSSLVYPGFPTDAGPLLVAALITADGKSVFLENIFENRFKYIDELNRLGGKVKIRDNVAEILGGYELFGANVECTDLRGGAALVVAGLAAGGKTVIDKIHHIERGYDDIVGSLRALDADIIKEQ